MASRKTSRTKIPDVFVIQDYSVSSPEPPFTPVTPRHSPTPMGSLLSPSCIEPNICRRSNSTVSSIFDLSFESEQLDRALRTNNAPAVAKILQVHYGKFPIVIHAHMAGGTSTDRSSYESRSRRPSSRTTTSSFQDFEFTGKRTLTPNFEHERRISVTPEWDIPDIFRTSLHVAITHNSLEVIEVLLRHGIDPNEPRGNTTASERRHSFLHCDNHKRIRHERVIEESNELSASDESFCTVHQAQPETRAATSDTCTLSVPVPTVSLPPTCDCTRKQSLASVSSDLQPRASFTISLDCDLSYTHEDLFNMPPLYFAVQEKNEAAVCMLLQYGADPNISDRGGNTPLHLASTDRCYNANTCTELIRFGAKVRQSNFQGQLPVDARPNLTEIQSNVVKDMLAGKSLNANLN